MTRARAEQNDSSAILEHLEPRLLLSGTTYLVDSLADVVASDGAVTLREAIQAANTNVIVHEAPAGSSDDTDIVTFAASLAGGTITLGGNQLEITEDLEIRGLGADQLTIDANGRSRVFKVDESIAAGFDGLLITGGIASQSGGGGYEGGGIFGGNLSTITVSNSSVFDNYAVNYGGGIYVGEYGVIRLSNSGIFSNQTVYGGGGVYGDKYSDIYIGNSTVSGNYTENNGGGVYCWNGTISLFNTTVSDNSAVNTCGAILADSTVTAINSTIVRNSAGSRFGGVYGRDTVLRNTVVAGNAASIETDRDVYNAYTDSNSFIGTRDGDPMLMAGSTDTDGNVLYYRPLDDSPLVDGGDDSLAVDFSGDPLTIDQSGNTRITGAAVDIGAVEVDGSVQLAVFDGPFVEMLEGESSVVNVSLTSAPVSPLTVDVSKVAASSDSINVDIAVLEFDATNWDTPQQVTITAAEDANLVTDEACFEMSSAGVETVRFFVSAGDNDGQVYLVDSLADVVELDGQLTLREAIKAANTNAPVNEAPAGNAFDSDIVTFDPSLAGGAITISNRFLVDDDLEIHGLGADELTIDAQGLSGIFETRYGATFLVDGLTMMRGNWHFGGGAIYTESVVTVMNSTITECSSDSNGGGIYGRGSANVITVINSTLSGNSTVGERGGGIYGYDVTVTNSTISDSTARDHGGGIFGTTITVTNSEISGNSSTYGNGGAVYCKNIIIENSTISGNRAQYAGGIYGTNYGAITVTNSTISGNQADTFGGGIYGQGVVVVTSSTVADNTSKSSGGGIYGSNTKLQNTVVAGNIAASNPDVSGTLSPDNSHNFIGTYNGDPMLRVVTDASGTVMYYVPEAGSPLIDMGDNSLALDAEGDPLVTDQQGGTRIINGTVDIGAIEYCPASELIMTPSVARDMVEGESQVFDVSLTFPSSAPVEVSVDKLPGGNSGISADVSVLEFDAGNWNVPQSVTITAVQDADRDNGAATFELSAPGMDTVYLFIHVMDDDYQTYVVDSLADVVADDGFLTLREAIEAANTNTVVNEAPEGGEGLPDVITFAGVLSGGTITLDDAQLEITDDLEIRGLGADELTIDADELSRVFFVHESVSVLFDDVTISGGYHSDGNQGDDKAGGGIFASEFSAITVTDSIIRDNWGWYGGGIRGLEGSTIKVTNSTISGNSGVGAGGGISTSTASVIAVTDSAIVDNSSRDMGGGISGGQGNEITVIGSTISGNSAGGIWGPRRGGGIYGGSDSVITVTNSTINDNSTVGDGGGISGWTDSTIVVTNSTFVGNHASSGGGIYGYEGSNITVAAGSVVANNTASYGGGIRLYSGGTVTVTDSTVSGNSVSGWGGGISASIVTVTNSTIGENSSERDGGGIYGGEISVVNSTIKDNSALEEGGGINCYAQGAILLQNTVVAGNTAPVGADIDGLLLPGSSNNFIGSDSGDPMLRAVRGVHGAVLYCVPQAGSPLIDAGDNSLAFDPQGTQLATDQRGLSRIAEAAVDIGAVEFHGLTELVMNPPVARDMLEGESLEFEVSLTSAPAGPITVSVDKLPGGDSDISSDTLWLSFNADNWSLPQTITITAGYDVDLDSESATFALSSPGMDTVYILALAEDNGHQTYVVNSLLDMVLVDGRVSLREAIQAANTNMPVNEAPGGSAVRTDVITFDPLLAGHRIAMGGTELLITEDLEIHGIGAGEVTIDAGGMSNVFSVDVGVSVLFDALTITGGSTSSGGGGIFGREDSSVTVTNSTISGNSTEGSGRGAGIFALGDLTVTNSTISGNLGGESGRGGGIHGDGAITVTNSLISGNSAGNNGGGISSVSGSITVSNSTITGNVSGSYGGGIYASNASLVVTNSTIAGNTTENYGGGIYGSGVKMQNTVVSGNTARVQDDVYGGLSADSSNNFIGTDDGDPMLRTIIDASGGVLYYVPDTGSPLVDAGDNSLAVDAAGLPLAIDQRGRSRVENAAVDIGAIERPVEAELAVAPGPVQELLEGEQLVLSVSLTSAPSAPLTVNVDQHPGGSGEISADVSVLEFDAGNWNLPHAVTITAAEDADHYHDDVAAFALSAAGMDTVYVLVSVRDNDHQTYVVDSLVDLVAYDGLLTLREAIQAANTNLRVNEAPAGDLDQTDIVTFDPSLTGRTITLSGEELSITGDVEIRGPGAEKLTIDADRLSGVFYVGENVSALFDSLTITGGQWASNGGGIYGDAGSTVTVVNSAIVDNFCMIRGGGIYGPYVNVIDSTISDNVASSNGGGVVGNATVTNSTISGNFAGGSGGGFYGDSITLKDSTVIGNVSGNSGGGIGAGNNGDITVIASTITGNIAGSEGGGICGVYSTITVTDSTISGNSTESHGGGISGYHTPIIVTNSTIRGNLAKRSGGGIRGDYSEVTLINSTVVDNSSGEDGGGVCASSPITLTNSTVGVNNALSKGGGVYGQSTITSTNSTVYANTTADIGGGIYAYDDIELLNTVVAGNIAATDDDIFGTLSAESSNNFIGADDGDPMLRTIIDADGGVLYYIPDATSPLVNAGNNALAVDPGGSPLTTDQRGRSRVVHTTVDIGAIERPAEAELTVAQNPVLELIEGEQRVFTVSLTTAPSTPVTVGIDMQPGGSSDISADVSVLAFDADNWNMPHPVTITAAQDADRDNDTAFFALSAAGMDTVYVSVSAVDDDFQTYVVDSLGDTVAADGCMTLREAVEAASTNTAVKEAPEGCEGLTDVITFAPSLTGQTITLDAEQFDITDDLEIRGLGADDLTIDARDLSRVFFVDEAVSVLFCGITITGGNVSDENPTWWERSGGAIYGSPFSAITLTDSIIRDNYGYYSGGISGWTGSTITVTNSTISDNSAGSSGYAGIYGGLGSEITVTNSTISGNDRSGIFGDDFSVVAVTDSIVADNGGGGIVVTDGGALTVTGLTISDNGGRGISGGRDSLVAVTSSMISGHSSTSGDGGIYVGQGSSLTVTDSTISGNAGGNGAGISTHQDCTVTVINSTIADNSARSKGGGIYVSKQSSIVLINSTVRDNSAGSSGGGIDTYQGQRIVLKNTVVAGNISGSGSADIDEAISGSSSNYFIGTQHGDPKLTPVTDADGAVLYYFPLFGGPLIDAGSNALAVDADGDPLATDQIGHIRIYGPVVDIGAIEFMPADPPTDISLSAAAVAENLPAGTTVGVLSSTDPDPHATHTYALVGGVGDDDNGTFTIDGDTLKMAGSLNFEAKSSCSIRICSTNQNWGAFEKTFTISITDVNDQPVVSPIADVTVDEDADNTILNLSGSFDDPDFGDLLAFTLTGNTNTGLVAANIADEQLTLVYAADQYGSAEITVRATDYEGAWIEDTFTVTVNPANDPPFVYNPIGDVTVDEDSPDTVLDLSNIFGDIDFGDSLGLSISGDTNAELVSADLAGEQLTLSYTANESGTAEITVRATDSGGAYIDDTFTVTVNPANDAPFVGIPIANVTVDENAPDLAVDLSTAFEDIDPGDVLTFSVTGNSAPVLVDTSISGAELTLSYGVNSYGIAEITVRATDSTGAWAEDTFTVTVVSDGINQPLVANPIDDVTVDANAPDSVMDLSNVFEEPAATLPTLDYTAVEIDPVTGAPAVGTGLFTYTFTFYANDDVDASFSTTSLKFTGAIQQTKAFFAIDINDEANAEIFEDIPGSGYLAALDTWIYNGWQTISPDDTDVTGTTATLSLRTIANYRRKDVIHIVAAGDVTWNGRFTRQGATYDTSGTTGTNRLTLSVAGNTNPDLVAASILDSQLTLAYAPDAGGSAEITIRATDSTGAWAEDTFTVTVSASTADIVGRHLFYNNSVFDGENPAANANDDNAIATDKIPLLAGRTAAFANYTSYWRGINGIMIDVDSLESAPTTDDFVFRVGNDSDPGVWSVLGGDRQPDVAVRAGAGAGGSDRITLIWDDNVIAGQWLEVTVLAGGNIGLAEDDVFYFGSAPGETGNLATDAVVDESDRLVVRDNPHTSMNPAPVDDACDFNRDRKVNETDELIARDNATTPQTALKLITATGALPAASEPLPGDTDGNNTVDDADMAVFWNSFGQRGENLAADFNGDRRVNLTDFTIIRTNFGRTRIQAAAAPPTAPQDVVASSVENTDDGGTTLTPVAHTAPETRVDLLALQKTPVGIETCGWNGLVELPSLRGDFYGPLPMRVDSSIPHRIATAEYDLYPPDDDLPSDDSLYGPIGADAFLDILAESLVTMPL